MARSLQSLLPAALALLAVGCAHAPSPLPAPTDPGPLQTSRMAPPLVRVGDPAGLRLAERARRLLERGGELVRRDCSGLVETVFHDEGLVLPVAEDLAANAVTREYVGLKREDAIGPDRPLPGDLAFFHDTYDRNRNGRLDDPLTHVALVTALDLDGTVTLIHFGSHGLAELKMNLGALHDARDRAGHRINDRLRYARRRDPPNTRYLASELFTAFGHVPEQREVAGAERIR